MKKNKVKDQFLEQLKKVPIVQVACEKVGVSRNSVYRWRNEDEAFRAEMETALAEGEELVSDMSESQLLSLIRDKNWNAISFWLRKRSPKFRDRIEVTTPKKQEKLSPEQETRVREAIRLSATNPANNEEREHENNSITSNAGSDAQGSQGAHSDH